MFAPPKQGQTQASNTVKIKSLIDTLVANGINPKQFGLDFNNTEDFTTQTDKIELALDALNKVQVSVDLDNFASKKYNVENLPNDATIALDIERTPFLSSKLMIKMSDKITDTSVPLEVQKEDLRNQETNVTFELGLLADTIKKDMDINKNDYLDKQGNQIDDKLENDFYSDYNVVLTQKDFNERQNFTSFQGARNRLIDSLTNGRALDKSLKIVIPARLSKALGQDGVKRLKSLINQYDQIQAKKSAITVKIEDKLKEQAEEARKCKPKSEK
jgi:hypothetical protein